MRILCKHWLMLCIVLILALFCSCISGPVSDTAGNVADTLSVEYLEEVTPPCTPIGDPPQDPCRFETVPYVETLSVNASSVSLGDRRPNFANTVLGVDMPGFLVPHIEIRGTGQPGTTRCEVYPVKLADYVEFSNPGHLRTRGHYYCFVDIAVGEYLIGTGPPTLTVAIHREHIRPFDVDDWPEERDSWIRAYADPRARTAAAYEGRELVMLLRATSTIHVEAWTSRGIFTLWFVQQGDGDDIRAVAYEMYLARTDEQRNRLDLALSDLVSQIRAAGAARAERIAAAEDSSESRSADSSTTSATSSTVTTAAGTVRPVGGIGARAPVPLLVTDANYLRNLYVEVGATYEGENATTVLPPPPPEAPGMLVG